MGKANKGYHKLLIWRKAREFVSLVYRRTEKFPRSEDFGLRSQIRRAVVSVVLNIVEGHRRQSTKEFMRFLYIASASLTEVEACLELALDLGFLKEEDFEELERKRSEVAFMLDAFIKGLRRKSRSVEGSKEYK